MRNSRRARESTTSLSRRAFLRGGVRSAGALGLGLLGAGPAHAVGGGADTFGPLQPADGNGLMLPPGFTSRIVATTGQLVAGTSHLWHAEPDGGATFPTGDGGWVYVSNSERGGGNGGVGAIRFDAAGNITNAYSILTDTNRNCAGGPTPWGTWLSCEEVGFGLVYECDPLSPGSEGVVRLGLGAFAHEAAAVDPVGQQVYLTEDLPDGLLYRMTPTSYPDLNTGTLEAAEILDPLSQGPIAPGQVRPLDWHVIANPNPSGGQTPTHEQAPSATVFNGGEGCWYAEGRVYISTKGNNRVWCIDTANDTIEILYDLSTSSTPDLVNVDNVYVTQCGDVLVAEDPGDLQIVALTPTGAVKPVMQLTGVTGTEICGPALDPSGTRLYFSSQRNPGQTFEITGPFAPLPGVSMLGGTAGTLAASALAGLGAWSLRRRAAERG